MLARRVYDYSVHALAGVDFGAWLDLRSTPPASAVSRFESDPRPLLSLFYAANGLLVLKGLQALESRPHLLLRLSCLFGPEVENYRQTLTTENFFHESIDQILVLSNLPPCSFEPPAPPVPARLADGGLPVEYPHRKGWHTDQSYRRPPPDVSLLLGVRCPPGDQGQTLYADGISAYERLPVELRERVTGLAGIHAMRGTGRTEKEVRSRAPLKSLREHQLPQRQPLVRTHPVTGKRCLYLCDGCQMDYVDGPVLGLETGTDGEGAALLDELLARVTRPDNVYVHEWEPGDLVVHDNRNMLHTPTWYDSARFPRVMWRTTVMGDAGEEYANGTRSWIPAARGRPMEGLEDLEF